MYVRSISMYCFLLYCLYVKGVCMYCFHFWLQWFVVAIAKTPDILPVEQVMNCRVFLVQFLAWITGQWAGDGPIPDPELGPNTSPYISLHHLIYRQLISATYLYSSAVFNIQTNIRRRRLWLFQSIIRWIFYGYSFRSRACRQFLWPNVDIGKQ